MSELRSIQRFVKPKIQKKKRSIKKNGPFTDSELFKALERVGEGKPISETSYKSKKLDSDPSTMLFWKRFGSFNNAVEMLYGKQMKDAAEIDELYCVKLVHESGVSTRKQYLEKRDSLPEIFPSEAMILKLFGKFKTLFQAAENFCIKQQIMKCLEVKIKLGKNPCLDDYRLAGINVSLLLRKYVLLSEINKRVRLLEAGYEVKRGNFSQTDEDVGKRIERETKEVFKPSSEQLRL